MMVMKSSTADDDTLYGNLATVHHRVRVRQPELGQPNKGLTNGKVVI